GEAGFNALRRALRGPGHSLGGMGGRPSLPPSASQPGATATPNVNLTFYGASERPQEVRASMGKDGLNIDFIYERFERRAAGDIRAGRGQIDAAIKERYGLAKAW